MKIAVVGGGIAGLGAAHVLAASSDVEVLDAGPRPGGHARTVRADGVAVDTGFIVYNEANYPRLTSLFTQLGVPTQPSVMSFSVECACGVAWSSRRPWHAGPRLLREILRFLRTASVGTDDPRTLDEYVSDERYSESFRRHYLQPMACALWSAPPGTALAMPAALAIEFFEQHGMLGLRRRRWRTVSGGCDAYVDALVRHPRISVRPSTAVRLLSRDARGVILLDEGGGERRYEAAVVAVPAPRALGLLAEPTDDERRLLGAFETTSNETILHTDARLLPRRRADRSAWNYQAAVCGEPSALPTPTYSANRLQRLRCGEEYCITLNRTADIDPAAVVAVHHDEHPRMTVESQAARRELALLERGRVAFAGAWQGNGFHEDGLASGMRAAAAIRRALA